MFKPSAKRQSHPPEADTPGQKLPGRVRALASQLAGRALTDPRVQDVTGSLRGRGEDLRGQVRNRAEERLEHLIEQRRQEALDYQEYLAKLLDTAKQLGNRESDTQYPAWADNGARRALVDLFWPDQAIPVLVDTAIRTSKPHNWVGNTMKEKVVKRAIRQALPDDFDRFDDLFELVKARDEYR